jgi:aspartate carbamoyltransferase catalytic subunit
MKDTFPKNLIESSDLNKENLYKIFNKARYFEENYNPKEYFDDLKGYTIVLAFFESSTRTRLSFELAAKRLFAETLNFTASVSSLIKGESLADTIRTIDAMLVDMYVIRNQYAGVPTFVSTITNNIIINAGDGKHEHPTQALLDAYTILKHYGKFEGLKISIVGDIFHSRVARSNIIMLRELEAEVKFYAPGTLMPQHINCWNVELHNSIDEVIDWSDVVIMLRLQNERMQSGLLPSMSEYVKFYQVNLENFSKKDKIILLHPGPVNYGVEIDHRVTKLYNSMIDRQVSNGIFTRMAIMSLLASERKISL